MQVDYTPFIDRVIKNYEGGYGWNKKDPGGPTNFGITCYDLAEFEHKRMTSMAAWATPVRSMPLSTAETIYQNKYANGIRFNDLPIGPDCCMLDYGINSGVSRPILVARALVGLPAGGMDDTLIGAIQKVNPQQFVTAMNNERLRFMHAIKGGASWQEFGHGWQARVDDLATYCAHIIQHGQSSPLPPKAVDLSQTVTPKAMHVASTAGNTTMGGAAAAATSAHLAGFPWSTVAAVGIAVIVGGVLYEAYHDQAAQAANAAVHV